MDLLHYIANENGTFCIVWLGKKLYYHHWPVLLCCGDGADIKKSDMDIVGFGSVQIGSLKFQIVGFGYPKSRIVSSNTHKFSWNSDTDSVG